MAELKSSSVKKTIQPRTGELLVREGFITKNDLAKALQIQKNEVKETQLPLDALLVKRGFLNGSQMEILRGHPDLRKKMAQMVVDHEIANVDQVKEALRGTPKEVSTGQTLLKKGLITSDILEDLLQKQKEALDIGELAVRLQMIREIDLIRAISYKNSQRTIGEILTGMGVITPQDLSNALKKHRKRQKIGDILIDQGMISQKDFQAALKEHNRSTQKLGAFLVHKKLITYDKLYNALSRQYNIPYRSLDDFYYDEFQKNKLSKFVAEKYARRNLILPLEIEDKELTLAISYPDSFSAIDELKLIYRNLDMKAIFVSEQKFEVLFTGLYNKDFLIETKSEEMPSSLTEDINLFNFEKLSTADTKKTNVYSGTETEVKKLVDFIINYGVSIGASDIHFEQDRKGVKLRYRIDGICQEPDIVWLNEKLLDKPEAVISRIKVMSNLDISERRVPQDGVFRASYREDDKVFDLDFRVATCPAIVGENITIRILDSRRAGLGLENLNHSPQVLIRLKELFKSSAGTILVSGPTGSGKSSTLYAALKYINGPGIKIITAEDPIEYSFPGIMQTQINNKINLTFARLLRSFLRLDPDVILVGEIRDEETAGIAFDAAQTGHLLLSTIHTNDSVSSVTRLLDLGIDHNQIASNLLGVISQRLVRRNCTKCSRQVKPPKEEWSFFFNSFPSQISFYKGIGCKSCDFTGYSGRTLVSELFEMNRMLTLAVSSKTGEGELKRMAIKSGMRTMADDGMTKMNQISLSELIRVLPLEMIKEFKSRH